MQNGGNGPLCNEGEPSRHLRGGKGISERKGTIPGRGMGAGVRVQGAPLPSALALVGRGDQRGGGGGEQRNQMMLVEDQISSTSSDD